jgi:glycosyltransferase involved in cell wall biosynthesis
VSAHRAARPLTTRPCVSIVMPCYNYGHYLPRAVESVLSQGDQVDLDLIIIDDASPDGSGAVVEALAATDDRIRGVLHQRNQGHIATYNEGIAMIRGDYFVLLSADDMLTPGCLGRAAALLEAEPAVGFAYGHPLEFCTEPPVASSDVRSWTVWSGGEWLARVCRNGRNAIMCPEVVMRASVQHAIGGYNPELPHAGDLEMWLRAANVADVGRVNGANQAYYRIHDKSMQRTVYAGLARDLRERDDAYASVLLGADFRRGNGREHYRLARRALALTALDRVSFVIDHGLLDDEPVDDYLDYARSAAPSLVGSGRWRAVTRRLARARTVAPVLVAVGEAGASSSAEIALEKRSPMASAGVSARNVGRDLSGRVRWQRWRWTGL